MENAIAPYNFVPVSERIIASEELPPADIYLNDRNSGWFDLRMTTLTPLYTRGAKPVDSSEPEPELTYFHYPGDDTPILPGSGIRGMIRSVFEVMTHSRLEFVSQRRLFFRSFADAGPIRELYSNPERFDKAKLRGGQLVEANGQLVLRVSTKSDKGFVIVRNEGEVVNLTRRNRGEYRRPVKVLVTVGRDRHSRIGAEISEIADSSDGAKGWLIIPGLDVPKDGGTQRSWYQVILLPGEDAFEDYSVAQSVYDDYLQWGSMAHGRRFDKDDMSAPRKVEAMSPAFALVDPETMVVENLGATMMMHLRYKNAISDVAARSVAPGYREVDVDMAQAVFGTVRAGKRNPETDQIRGRVFIEDARCTERGPDALFDSKRPNRYVLLSGPKPTAFQTYLADQDTETPLTWEDDEARVAGRKMYWHRSAAAAEDALSLTRTGAGAASKTTEITPLRYKLTFKGRVRFENLTDVELGALYATIQLPREMAHKFGMGKNLGLGSIRVDTTVTLLDMRTRLASLAQSAGEKTDDECTTIIANCHKAFASRVAPKSSTLWGTKRMAALASLLSWDDKPETADTEQAPMGSLQWRKRWVLQSPATLVKQRHVTEVCSAGEPRQDINARTNAPGVRPVRQEATRYSERQEIFVTVISKSDYSPAVVRLDDGTELPGKYNVGMAIVGDRVKMKILRVDGKGTIKDMKRA